MPAFSHIFLWMRQHHCAGLLRALRAVLYPWDDPSGAEICLALPDLLDKIWVGEYLERFNDALDILVSRAGIALPAAFSRLDLLRVVHAGHDAVQYMSVTSGMD